MFLERMKEKLGPKRENWERIIVPVRPPEKSRVEVFFRDHRNGQADRIVAELERLDGRIVHTDNPWGELERSSIDYAKLMLGAPVIPLEMDDDQFKFCYDLAMLWMNRNFYHTKKASIYLIAAIPTDLIQDLTLANAMTKLSHIRKRFPAAPVPEGMATMLTADQLQRDAKKLKKRVEEEFEKRYPHEESS